MRVRLGYPLADSYRVSGPVTGVLYTFTREASTEVDSEDVPGLLALTYTHVPCCGSSNMGTVALLQVTE